MHFVQIATLSLHMAQATDPELSGGEPLGLRERKRLRTRRAIADAALRLFLRRGFAETTIPQIAEAADVSPRTVSIYFPHKEELAFPHGEEAFARLQQRLRDRRQGESTTDALLAWIVEWLAEEDRRGVDRAALRRLVASDEALIAYQQRIILRAREVLTEAFARDLGTDRDALEPRMAAAATITIFELLGEDIEDEQAPPGQAAAATLDRAMRFIGGGIRALRDG